MKNILIALLAAAAMAQEAAVLKTVRIWDQAPHNAFTDLVRYDGRWICAFREGSGHVSPDGAIRVLESKDGETWTSAALITSDRGDLRDAKISITPRGELMLAAAAALKPGSAARHQTYAWFSSNAREWSEPVEIGEPNYWLWRVVWGGKTGWGIGYDTAGERRDTRLYRTEDGRRFERVTSWVSPAGYANESGMVADGDGRLTILLRRDGEPNSALMIRSEAPYHVWRVANTLTRVGGPALMRWPDGRWLGAGRLYDGRVRTSLFWINPDSGELSEFLTLPSGGDTSYPGLVLHEGLLYVSYYSSHESRSSIYFSTVRIP